MTSAENLLNAARVEEIDDMAAKKMLTSDGALLRRITASFRSSTIIVVGYYPSFSEKLEMISS